MDKMAQLNPTISDLLDDFFGDYKHAATDKERRRIALVRQDLAQHLDAEGWRVLDDAQSAIAHYASPAHAQIGIDQQAAQVDVIEALARMLWKRGHISGQTACAHCRSELESEMKSARRKLRKAREREQILER